MTELDYLLELLLDHQLPEKTNKSIRSRIKVVQKQAGQNHNSQYAIKEPQKRIINGAIQSPSMAAKIEAMELEKAVVTPAAQAAVAQRAQAIAIAQSSVPEKGRTSPRKF